MKQMKSREEIVEAVGELSKYHPNPFLLFVMSLRLGTEDYDEIYRDNVLDGSDDKKVDFFRLDLESGCAILAQAYESPDWDQVDPPSNKAADLNTAAAWLLDSDLAAIPRPAIQAAAQQLRDALDSGQVHTVEAYYIHNCRRTKNVNDELATVEASLRNKLDRWAEKLGAPISTVARQLSLEDVVALYESRFSSIRIKDTVAIRTTSEAQWVSGPSWRAVHATAVAEDLVRLVQEYGEDMYTANIRDYLGWRASARNINKQIAETASKDPQNFWVFNNGISLITRKVDAKAGALTCTGIAVMNGAQTLGSLTEASKNQRIEGVQVLVRVVESRDEDLVRHIIRYNNTQNPIKPWELRVLDPVQDRLQRDFQGKLSVTYEFRRGPGRRSSGDILCEKLGPWLNSFYGDPITSHRNSPELYDDDAKYHALFSDASDVRHLLFVYRLGEAIGSTKDDYRAATDNLTANETQAALYGYFRYGVFVHVALHLCAVVLAELFGGGPSVKKLLVLSDSLERDREAAIKALKPLVGFTLAPIPSELENQDAYKQLRSKEGIEKLAKRVRVSVNQTRSALPEAVEKLKKPIRRLA